MKVNKKINKEDLELNVNLSYKVKAGSLKVSEKDLNRLGVGIVDEVVIFKVGEKGSMSLMLFSDSHITSGNVIIGVNDANNFNLEEGDKIKIKKLSEYKKSEKELTVKSNQIKTKKSKNKESMIKPINGTIKNPVKKISDDSNFKRVPLIKETKK